MTQFASRSDNEQIGSRLAALRAHLGKTQVEMARAIEVSPRTYQNYERGEREVSATVVRSIYRAFAIDPIWLLDGEPGAPKVRQPEPDIDLLQVILEEIERKLGAMKKQLVPIKKARLAALLYDHFRSQPQPDAAFIERAIRLAA